MIKDATPQGQAGKGALLTEPPTPEATVLVGVFFIIFAQVLCVLPTGVCAF